MNTPVMPTLPDAGSTRPFNFCLISSFSASASLGIDNSLLLASFDIQIEPVEAHGVGAGARPVDVFEPVAAFGLAVFQREIAVLMQPGIQVHAARKRLESVIGDHHQQRVVVDLFHHAADELVHALVEILNHLAALRLRHIARRRMIFFQIAPEHVLHAVGGIEHAGAEPLLASCRARRTACARGLR